MAKITTDDNRPEALAAEALLKDGVTSLIAAFNLAGGRPWAFPPKTKDRAMVLLKEFFPLFDEGGFKTCPDPEDC